MASSLHFNSILSSNVTMEKNRSILTGRNLQIHEGQPSASTSWGLGRWQVEDRPCSLYTQITKDICCVSLKHTNSGFFLEFNKTRQKQII